MRTVATDLKIMLTINVAGAVCAMPLALYPEARILTAGILLIFGFNVGIVLSLLKAHYSRDPP